MLRRSLPSLGGLIALCATILATPQVASGDPLGAAHARATQIASQIQALQERDSALSQRYDGAVLRVQQVDGEVAQARAELQAATAEEARTKAALRNQAVSAYLRGGDGVSLVELAQGNDVKLLIRSQYLHTATGAETDAVDQLHLAREAVMQRQAQLAADQAQAQAAVASIDASRQQDQQTEARLNGLYAEAKGQLATLVAQATQAQASAGASTARARLLSAGAGRSGGGPTVPVSGAAGTAVSVAEAQVGKPYVWGAAGPGAFDCSGLVMYAWAAAGVQLPHYTVAQYDATTHISLGQLAPGDLLFSGDLGHVAIYVGNGEMVEAPYTGADVRVVPVRSEMDLASRP